MSVVKKYFDSVKLINGKALDRVFASPHHPKTISVARQYHFSYFLISNLYKTNLLMGRDKKV